MNADRERSERGSVDGLPFSPVNGVLLLVGLAAITAGFVLLADGSTVAAPLLLTLGYVVLIPLGIIAGKNSGA